MILMNPFMSLFSQGCSQTKWEAVYGMGAQTRFGQKKKAMFFVLFLLGTSDKVL